MEVIYLFEHISYSIGWYAMAIKVYKANLLESIDDLVCFRGVENSTNPVDGSDTPAVWRFSDKEAALRYLEKSISGMRNVASDFTSCNKESS